MVFECCGAAVWARADWRRRAPARPGLPEDGRCMSFHLGRPRRLSANQPPPLCYILKCEEPRFRQRQIVPTAVDFGAFRQTP